VGNLIPADADQLQQGSSAENMTRARLTTIQPTPMQTLMGTSGECCCAARLQQRTGFRAPRTLRELKGDAAVDQTHSTAHGRTQSAPRASPAWLQLQPPTHPVPVPVCCGLPVCHDQPNFLSPQLYYDHVLQTCCCTVPLQLDPAAFPAASPTSTLMISQTKPKRTCFTR
jgi:hypothetical protein